MPRWHAWQLPTAWFLCRALQSEFVWVLRPCIRGQVRGFCYHAFWNPSRRRSALAICGGPCRYMGRASGWPRRRPWNLRCSIARSSFLCGTRAARPKVAFLSTPAPAAAYPGLDPGIVQEALGAGVQASALQEMSRLVRAGPLAKVRAEPKQPQPDLSEDVFPSEPKLWGWLPNLPVPWLVSWSHIRNEQLPPSAQSSRKLWTVQALLGARHLAPDCPRRNSARKALKEALHTSPADISAVIEGLTAEDLVSNSPVISTSARLWLVHRSREGSRGMEHSRGSGLLHGRKSRSGKGASEHRVADDRSDVGRQRLLGSGFVAWPLQMQSTRDSWTPVGPRSPSPTCGTKPSSSTRGQSWPSGSSHLAGRRQRIRPPTPKLQIRRPSSEPRAGPRRARLLVTPPLLYACPLC